MNDFIRGLEGSCREMFRTAWRQARLWSEHVSNIADTMLSSRLLIRWNVRANLTSKQLLYKVGIPVFTALVLGIIAWRLGGPGSGATQWMPYLAAWMAVVLSVFHIGARPLIGISLMLIMAGAIALASGQKPLAEKLGETAFYFLAMGIIMLVLVTASNVLSPAPDGTSEKGAESK